MYQRSKRLVEKEAWSPFAPDEYANLLFIDRSPHYSAGNWFNTVAKVYMKGASSTIHKRYTTKIKDIFKKDDENVDSSELVLIEGVAGIGKTILCKEIAYRWACGRLLSDDKLVLLVFLRDPAAQKINSVEDLVCYFYKSESKFSELSCKLICTEGNHVTIILDGFDEISHETEFFQCLLFKEILPLCRIVVTSRPTSSSMTMLQDLATVNVEILGFTKENRQMFIENGLKDNTEKLTKLNSYLKTNSVIDQLCYIPFMLSILVCIAKEYNELPKSRTDVYTKFIVYTISKFLQRFTPLSCTISQINELPPPYKAYFLDICKYAYNALQCDKIVFTANEIKTGFTSFTDAPSSWSGLGLLKSAQYFSIEENNDRISYNFLHLSIQEYLAAYYISTLGINQQLNILKKYFFNEKYLNMWIMYTGVCEKPLALRHFLSGKKFYYISKFFGINKISNSILQSKIKCLYLFQCLPELKDSNLHNHIGHVFESGRLNLSGHPLLEKDINMLTSILDKSATTHWKKLNLSDCDIGDIGCDQLCKDLRAIDHQLRFDTINLSGNLLTGESLTAIADILMHCQTKRVHLSNNTHIYNIAAIYLAKVCAFKDTLKTFPHSVRINDQENIVLKSLDQQNVQKVISQLNPRYWITGVDLINCKISRDVISAITRTNRSLNRLCIWNCHISINVISHLLKIMPAENKSKLFFVYAKSSLFDDIVLDMASKNYYLFMFILLDDVSLILHRVSYMHIKYLIFSNPTLLPKTNQLTKIKIFKCKINNETAKLLLELFRESRMLAQFILVDNNFRLKLLEQTISAIKDYPSLREIYISDYNLTYDDYCAIANELSCNQMHSIVMFYKNFLRCFRNLDEQLDFKAIRLQPLEGTSQKAPHCVTYVKNYLSNDSDLCTLQSVHIGLYKSKLILNKINDYLTSHMIINSQSLELIYLTKIDFTCCKMKNITVISLLLQKIITCEQLTSFIYSDNDITVNSTIFTQFMYDLIALPYLRRLYVHELSLKKNNIKAMQNWLCNYPKLKSVIKNDDMVTCSNCNIKSYDEVIFSKANNIGTLWLQYCKINIVALCDIVYHSLFTEVVINNSMIYAEETQLPDQITTSIKSLDLSHNQITRSALKVLMSIILNSFNIQELYLINNQIQLEMTRMAGKVILSFQQLHLYNDNVLDVAKDLADAISFKHCLQILFLNEMYLVPTITVVTESLKKNSELKELNLNGTMDKRKLLPSQISNIIKNNSLQKLCLKDMNLETEGTIKIGKNLQDISSLKVLDLQNNFITEEAGEVLASIISSNTKLEELYLGNNHLQAGIIKVFTELKKISSLRMLDLENNGMSKEVATELAAAISSNSSLQKLWLDNNNNLGSSMESVAAACSKISNLEQLCITNTGISNKVGKDIAFIISNNRSIIQLSISDNNLRSPGIKCICHALMHINALKYFHACCVNATATVSRELKMVIDANMSLEEISLSDNLLETTLIEITESCSKLSGLKILELSHNCISPLHVNDLVSNVNKIYSLESLSLGGITLNVYENLYLNIFKKASTFTEGNDNNEQHTIVEYACCELLKMTTTQDFSLNYDTIYLSYIYKYVHISYQYEEIFNKIFVNKTECKSIVREANRKISQIDSEAMISSLLIIKTLKVINLENNNIDEESAKILADHLQCNNILEQLWLQGNELYDKGALVILKSLHNLSTLLILDLSFNHLGTKSADDIAVVISANCLLQQLWLDGNDLLTRGVVIIARALKMLSSLRILSLCSNGITDDAAEEISNVITSNVLLVDLLLGNNQLKTTGVDKIAVALSKVLTLRKLDLFNNNITSDAADELADALSSCTNLQQLFLSNNMLGTEGTIKLAYALRRNNSLQVLTLSNNNITKFAADVLVDVLKKNFCLKIVLIGGNDIQTTGINLIVETAKNINTLQLLDVSDNKVTEHKRNDFKKFFANIIIIV